MNPVLDKKDQSSKKNFIKSRPKLGKKIEKLNIQEVRPIPYTKISKTRQMNL